VALTILVLLILIVPKAQAQLTGEDIRKLQEQAKAENWSFTVGENPATQYPLEDLCGLVVPENWQATANFDPCTPTKELPVSFDWREITGCPPIRNQGSCGSCWAFATTGALECGIRVQDGIDVDLSEQWLVSCNNSGWDCGGGWFAHDYHLMETDDCDNTGAVLEEYFPYTATDEPCNCPYPHSYFLDSWASIGDPYGVPSNEAMKQAILDHGPISIALYVGYAFQAYNSGVFTQCGVGTVNHAVVLVGWDDDQGLEGVWILRNSWGPGWGEGGYMRIKYNCVDFGTGANYVIYSREEKVALIGDEVWDDAGGDNDSIPEAGETVQMVLSFESRYTTELTDVTASLFFDDASLNITQGTAFLGNIIPNDTITNFSNPFEFEIPADYTPRTNLLGVEFVWDGGASIDTQMVNRVIGGVPILVVDDDNGDNIDQYYLEYLDDMRVPYDVWSISGGGKPGSPIMSDYPIIFWFTGDFRPNIMNRAKTEIMMDFLNGGGKMFLSGQGIANNLSNYDLDFLNNYLKADYVSSLFIPVLGGESEGQIFMPGDSIIILGGSGAYNQSAPDQIIPVNGAVAELSYLNNPAQGAISYTGDYQLLFFSFGFEAITNGDSRWTDRDIIFDRIIDYFSIQTPGESPQAQGLAVSPGDPTHMIEHSPTFSWNYSDPVSEPQQMCHLQVTEDKYWLMSPVWDSGPVSDSETEAVYGGSGLIDGMQYYIRARASNGTLWSDWCYADMRMNSVPIPAGLSPDNMEWINGEYPELTHETAEDSEGDSLTYSYELYDDSLMSTLLAQKIDEPKGKSGSAAWQVPMILTPDDDYYWRVQAVDPFEGGQWSDLASFWVMSYIFGDANYDQTVNVGDAVYIISYVFKGGPAPEPLEAGDANCDGECNVGDAVFLINYIFKGGPEPTCP
jgi:hypothetical protein